MSSFGYPGDVLEYVQSQGWTANLSELREGVYIITGEMDRGANSQKLVLMAVCKPKKEVTLEHIKYLIKYGQSQNANSVLLTYTVGMTQNAQNICDEYSINIIESGKVRSHSETAGLDAESTDTRERYIKSAAIVSTILILVTAVLFIPNGIPIVTDGDGVSVYDEFTAGTNPFVGDTDGDGLSDERELGGPTDPTVADTDGDDLNDSKELNYGTDPTEWDTDGDGIADGTEVKRSGKLLPGADPLRKNIYIEIDYMGSHRISDDVKRQIKQMFASSPVENPDGSTGIDLHLKRSNQVESEPNTNPDDYSRIREQNADNPGKGYFYVLLVNNVKLPTQDDPRENYRGAGGYGRMYLRGDLSNRDTRLVFTHEMGHLLGLTPDRYRGIDSTEVSYQRYQSVMNYNVPRDGYQYSGEESSFNDWKFIEKRMASPPIQNTNASD